MGGSLVPSLRRILSDPFHFVLFPYPQIGSSDCEASYVRDPVYRWTTGVDEFYFALTLYCPNLSREVPV